MSENKQRVAGFVSGEPLDAWPDFSAAVRARLERGREEYGDRSFVSPPDGLLDELQQEALDLAGWGFVLYERLGSMRRRLAAIEEVG